MEPTDKINVGDYIIIQRQKYTKLHKFSSIDSKAILAKEQIELRNLDGQNYNTTFKMIPKENQKNRLYFLDPCIESKDDNIKDLINLQECGNDNRNIFDDGQSQTLKMEDIKKLKDVGTSSKEIVEQLVENSKTFASKTEYAQEKYLKKKEKKYFEYIIIKKPTIRLISEIFYRQDSDKILGLRPDSLSQIISYSGVCDDGNYLLYESGTNGLTPAAILNSIGSNTTGKLIHMHPGNVPQRQAIYALNLPREQYERCISVNIYSVLRHYYQNVATSNGEEKALEETVVIENDENNGKLDDDEDNEVNIGAKRKLNSGTSEEEIIKKLRLNNNDVSKVIVPGHQKWILDNINACQLLVEKLDALIIVAKEYPLNIIKELLLFIKPGRPMIIFSLSRELLMEMYVELKQLSYVTNLRLTSNWMRMYQILPNRTHPDVHMNGSGGYLLYGYTLG